MVVKTVASAIPGMSKVATHLQAENNLSILLNINFSTNSTTAGSSFNVTTGSYCWLGVYMCMTALGLCLNTLTIFIIQKGSNVSKEIRLQIINLAIADLLMTVVDASQLILWELNLPFPASLPLCQFYRFVRRISCYGSLLCSVSISLERFVIVFFPFRATRYTSTHKLTVISVVWICAALSAIRGIVDAAILDNNGVLFCGLTSSTVLPHNVYLWLLSLEYIIPAFIIVVAYSMVFIKLGTQKCSNIRRNSSNQWRKDLDKVRQKCFTEFEC